MIPKVRQAGRITLNQTTRRTVLSVLLTILAAVLCGNLHGAAFGFLRALLYIGLFSYWGITLYCRVIQTQVRRALTWIAFLMVFWIFVRTLKYLLIRDPDVMRQLWYLYYLPMLFIPFLSVLVALSLGEPAHYRLPSWSLFCGIPVLALLLLVLTNDFHQLVFHFPEDAVIWTDYSNYTYGIGYAAVFASMVLCAFVAIGIMLYKYRGPKEQPLRWTPFVPVLLSVVYSALYAFGVFQSGTFLGRLFGDLTVVQCLLFAATLECCLQSGLIASNTSYAGLFRVSSVGMQITDRNYNVKYESIFATPWPKEILQKTEAGEYRVNESTMLKGRTIRGGHVIWQKDVSELLKVKDALESTREELQDRIALLREQYARDAKRHKLEEQNRLYDLVQRETQRQLKEIEALSDQLSKEADNPVKQQALLLRIVVLATYIKRRKDMVLAADRYSLLPAGILESALRESCSNLSFAGTEGNVYVPDGKLSFPMQEVLSAYEFFEDALEQALDGITYFYVTLSSGDNGSSGLHFHFECTTDLSNLSEKNTAATLEQTDDGWFVFYPLTAGGYVL